MENHVIQVEEEEERTIYFQQQQHFHIKII